MATPFKGRNKPEWQKGSNRLHARLRGPGERMFAQLKTWSILDQIRCNPERTTQLAKAVQVLNTYERQLAGSEFTGLVSSSRLDLPTAPPRHGEGAVRQNWMVGRDRSPRLVHILRLDHAQRDRRCR